MPRSRSDFLGESLELVVWVRRHAHENEVGDADVDVSPDLIEAFLFAAHDHASAHLVGSGAESGGARAAPVAGWIPIAIAQCGSILRSRAVSEGRGKLVRPT